MYVCMYVYIYIAECKVAQTATNDAMAPTHPRPHGLTAIPVLTKPVKAQDLLIPKSGSRPQHPRMYLANGSEAWEIHNMSIYLNSDFFGVHRHLKTFDEI